MTAPRNQKLTVTPDEKPHYLARCLRLHAPTDLATIVNDPGLTVSLAQSTEGWSLRDPILEF